MYVKRFDAVLAWLKIVFPAMEITADLRDIDSQNAAQLKAGIVTLIAGPAHSFDKVLHGQEPYGRQILSLVIQKKLSAQQATNGNLTRAELALMDTVRKLQNHPNVPPEAAGLVVRDIVPSQQAKAPDLEIIATFEVID